MSDTIDQTLETNVLPDLPFEEDDDQKPTGEPGTAPDSKEPEVEEPDDLRRAMTELAGTVRKIAEPAAPAPPAPTPEQIAEYWRVYDPEAEDKQFFSKFFRLPEDATPEMVQTHKEIFANMQKGLMRQAVTAARNYIQMAREEMDQEFAPIREYVETSKREATRGRFYGDYPVLEDKKYQTIIDAVARSLDNKTFDGETEYFQALAEGAAGAIKAILPDFDLGAKPTTKKPGQTLKLPRTSAGGGGGAGKGATHDALAATGKRNDIDSLEDTAE